MAVVITKDNLEKLLKGIDALTSREVLVGVPVANDKRSDSTFGNAGIGYINEFGSPSQNIPPRPHLFPGMRQASDKIVATLRKTASDALNVGVNQHPEQMIDAGLTVCGMAAVSAIQEIITAGIPPPLKRPRPSGGATPLIDTGQYRQSITFILRSKAHKGTIKAQPVLVTPARESDITAGEVETIVGA